MSFCQPVHIKSHKLNFRFNALTNFLKDGPIRPSYEYMYEKSIPPFDDVASACNTIHRTKHFAWYLRQILVS